MKEKILALMGFSVHRDNMKIEILSGLTTFTSMVYILALLPAMFAPMASVGFPVDSVFTSIILATIVGTLLMVFLAKRPFGQAPGLTLNIFFIETVCLSLDYPWQFALTAVLIEGLLFVMLCLSNLRKTIFEMVPASLKYAIAAGIGFFIAMLGFKNSGLLADGTVFNHLDTLATPSSMLFALGLILTSIFSILRIKGGLLLSIILITLLGIPFGLTTMPHEIFSMPASPAPLFCQFSGDVLLMPDLGVGVLIRLFFDVFDSLGTIVGIMACSGLIRKNGRIPHMTTIMLSDALATVAGACLGCSTVTTYAESATGFAEGGRTGVSAFVVVLCFTASLFMAPLFLAIPAAATAPVMVVAGLYLFGAVRHISLADPKESLPVFVTILLMPVTGSITDGIMAGLLSYVILSFLSDLMKRRKTNIAEEDLQSPPSQSS